MKILIYSIPNDGHLNILKHFVAEYGDQHECEIILVDQKTTPVNTEDFSCPVHTLKASQPFCNTSEKKVFQRVAQLFPECLSHAQRFNPDLIIYDFPALEGYCVSRYLSVPGWSSVPGMIGPLKKQEYLAECLQTPENLSGLAALRANGVDIDVSQVELISNCLHIAGDRNLLWSYPSITPDTFMLNRVEAQYSFVGYIKHSYPRHEDTERKPCVYISLGTEVMNNLWERDPSMRAALCARFSELADLWAERDMRVVFVKQGREIMDRYPANWEVSDSVDQQAALAAADVFLTHGGSNSFHEALLQHTPVVVLPFFGDQILVGQRAEELGVGVTLRTHDDIRRDQQRNFLGPGLAEHIDAAVSRVLDTPHYAESAARPLPKVEKILP